MLSKMGERRGIERLMGPYSVVIGDWESSVYTHLSIISIRGSCAVHKSIDRVWFRRSIVNFVLLSGTGC